MRRTTTTTGSIPAGRLESTKAALAAAGCLQAGPHYFHVFQATHGNPCATCAGFDAGNCPAFARYHTGAVRWLQRQQPTVPHNVRPGHPLDGLSVRKLAERLGVSVAEVRRRKREGRL